MENELYHHGVKGQKWGVRRYQNSDGSRTNVGKSRLRKNYSPNDSVFISGKVSYDKPLSNSLKSEIDKIIKARSRILIGDAPGADTRVQDYLASKKYSNVTVYTTDKKVRNNIGNWNVERISGNGFSDERSIRRQKDIAMTRAATRGLAIMPADDRPGSAMSLNVQRMNEYGIPVLTYDFNEDIWHSDELYHHGVKGQKWGIRRYQNKDGSLTEMGKKVRNYNKIIDSLTDEEYRLFSNGDDRSQERKFIRAYTDEIKNNKERIFISKSGNIVMASVYTNGLGNKEWDIGWATNPHSRGTGITQSNIREAISLIRGHNNYPIVANIELDNIPSIKTAEKAGFVDNGYTRMGDNSIRRRYVYN